MSRSVVLCIICLIFSYIHAEVCTEEYRDVETLGGTVRGYLADDGDYMAYLGVPYATTPLGKNRFKAPLPPPSWDGIFEANRNIKCAQKGEGNEDCLVLNIFTPIEVQTRLLPVLIYFHGGAFLTGSSQKKGGEPLTKENIIVITVNYRLGALGFLCLGIKEAPGNAGMKDQVAALKWVQNNIANFGGDPKQVTIYGLSAGGVSVELHILSQMSKGLFQRAIAESGSVTTAWAIDAAPITTAQNVANLLNIPQTNNVKTLVDYYRRIPADELTKVNYEYFDNLTDDSFGFVPCIERELDGIEPFLTKSPYETLTKEKYDQVPMLFSFVTSEGLFTRSKQYHEQNYKERLETNFADFLPPDLVFDSPQEKEEIAAEVKNFYFGNGTIGDDMIENLKYFDDLIIPSVLNSAEIQSKNGNPVYLLEFAYKGNMGGYEEINKNINLPGHGDIVKHAILEKPILNINDQITVDRMAKLIANFVKFGNPTPRRTYLLPTIWPKVNTPKVKCLRLDKKFQVTVNPYYERKTFWDDLYAEFRRTLVPVDPELSCN